MDGWIIGSACVTYEEGVEVVLVVRREEGSVVRGVGVEQAARLRELRVDEGEVVDGRGHAQASHVRRHQLLAQRVHRDLPLDQLPLLRLRRHRCRRRRALGAATTGEPHVHGQASSSSLLITTTLHIPIDMYLTLNP
jgi:hypothetical protein